MPKINQYTDNSTIEDTDATLTYDPSNGGATKLTTFARIASWMSAKLAALAKKTAITSADQILMVNGSATARIDYNVLAKAIIEQYAGSTVAGSAQSVKAALDALNSNIQRNTQNLLVDKSVSFSVRYRAVGSFHYGMLAGGSQPSSVFVGFVFISNAGGNFAVSVAPILNPADCTIVGTYDNSDGTITFTPTISFYGGLRYIDLS